MSIKKSAKEYLDRKKALGVYSPETVRTVGAELGKFQRFCQDQNITRSDDITVGIVSEYMGNRDIALPTRGTVTINLQGFLRFLYREGHMTREIILELPRAEPAEMDCLTPEELKKLFKDQKKLKTPEASRNLLMLALFADLCLRVSEVMNLKLVDVRLPAKEIWVTRKGNKIVRVPINDGIAKLFQKWYAQKKTWAGSNSKYVFISTAQPRKVDGSRSRRLTSRQAHRIVAKAFERSGIHKRKSGPHTLRHTGASIKANAGENLIVIQHLLGHKNLNTTRKYLHTGWEDMRGLVERNSVLED